MAERTDPRRVLLIDDEEDLVWSLVRRLRRALGGAVVEGTTRPEEALSAGGGRPFDAIVTDIRMPTVSGLEVLVEARRRWPALPFVVMTAYPAEFMRVGAGGGGGLGYLEKPFELGALARLVERALAQGAAPGFAGEAARREPLDLVQVFLLSNLSGALRFSRGDRGAIWFDRGRVTHAACPGRRGAAAFYELLTWGGSSYAVERGGRPPAANVAENANELVTEGLARLAGAARPPPAARGDRGPPDRPKKPTTAADRPPRGAATAPLTIEPTGGDKPQAGATLSHKENPMSNDVQAALESLRSIDGYVGSCLVDSDSGMTLGADGGGPALNLEVAAAGNTEVVRAKRKAMRALNLKDDIEDMLITLGKQYHLIRPMRNRPAMFAYLVVDRSRANLAMARITLNEVERKLSF